MFEPVMLQGRDVPENPTILNYLDVVRYLISHQIQDVSLQYVELNDPETENKR